MSKFHDLIHERFLFVLILLFILSSAAAYALASETTERIDVIIDIFAVLTGVIAILLILNIVKSFKGSLRKSFNYLIFGIAFILIVNKRKN